MVFNYLKNKLVIRSLALLKIGLALFSLSIASAQQPGGVTGTRFWYVTKLAKPNYLIDISGHNITQLTTNAASVNNLNLNFHPATFFSGNEVSIPIPNFNANAVTCVGIFYPDQINVPARFIVRTKDNTLSLTLRSTQVDSNNNKKIFSFGNVKERTNFQIQPPYTTVATSMKTGLFYYPWKELNHSIWGGKSDMTLSSSFKGYIPELIIYNRNLSNREIRQIQSYLCIKYGTTLDTTYVNSKDEIIWDVNDVNIKPFHNRVAAIGRDSLSGLWQHKSNTTYEDNGYVSYQYDADSSRTNPNLVKEFIPASDTPSLYRSLTMEFEDKNPYLISNNKFIFWGDNNGTLKVIDIKSTTLKVDNKKYPSLKVVNDRKWIVYNKNNIVNATKLVIAGALYDTIRNSLFNRLYYEYDYQRYRYVLLSIRRDSVVNVKLNSYFGREWFGSEKFSTRTIVWDSLRWNNEKDPYHIITFGKVPVLNILEIGKDKSKLEELDYPYLKSLPISNSVVYDTLETVFEFKKLEKDAKIVFTIPGGLSINRPTIKVFENEKWKLLPINTIQKFGDTIVNNTVGDIVQGDSTQNINQNLGIETANSDTMSSTPALISSSLKSDLSEITRQPPYEKYKTKYIVTTEKLRDSNTFLIEISDNLGQVTSLPFKTKKSN